MYYARKHGQNIYYSSRKIKYKLEKIFRSESMEQALDFSYNAVDKIKEKYRNGIRECSKDEMLFDTLEGKLNDIVTPRQERSLCYIGETNFNNYFKDKWNSYDLVFLKNDKSEFCQIKTIKYFSQFLLLEATDYENNRSYKFLNGNGPMVYNRSVFKKIKCDESKNYIRNILYIENIEINLYIKKIRLFYDIVRFIKFDEFVSQVIKKNYLFKQGSVISTFKTGHRSRPLEVNNCYDQVYDMHAIS